MRAIRRRVGREFCPYATKSRDECWNQPAVTHKNLVTAHSTAATDFAREILAVLRRSPMSCGALVWSDADVYKRQTNFASSITDAAGHVINGPVSWLSYAFRFMQLPLGLFGVAKMCIRDSYNGVTSAAVGIDGNSAPQDVGGCAEPALP